MGGANPPDLGPNTTLWLSTKVSYPSNSHDYQVNYQFFNQNRA